MKKINVILILLGISICYGSAQAETEKPHDFNTQMSEAEFKASGLSKLSPQELEYLQQWLAEQQVVNTKISPDESPIVTADTLSSETEQEQEDRFGLIKKTQRTDKILRSRIPGTFKGWKGETIFVLENGQVWKQRLRGRWAGNLENPEIEIYQTKLGYFNMRILSVDRKIGVKRIK